MKKATRLSVATTVVAMPLSFFRNVVGFLGAVLFWPLTVYLPVEMYITGLLQENQCTRRLRSVSIATNGGFKGSLTGIMSTQKVWHSMQGDIAFADSFNIDIEIQCPIKASPPSESKVTQKAIRLSHVRGRRCHTRSSSPTPTTGAFKRSGMRIARAWEAVGRSQSHGTPTLTRVGDCSLPSDEFDWSPIMGSIVINRDESCVICATLMCMVGLYSRRLNENDQGANSCLLNVTDKAVKYLKDMCKESKAWTPNVGAPNVEGVLNVIRSLKKGIPTVHENISLRLKSYVTVQQAGKLSPLVVTSMLQKEGPVIGVLYAGGEYFWSTEYLGLGDTDFPANHAVVCTGYRYIHGELFIIIVTP